MGRFRHTPLSRKVGKRLRCVKCSYVLNPYTKTIVSDVEDTSRTPGRRLKLDDTGIDISVSSLVRRTTVGLEERRDGEPSEVGTVHTPVPQTE